MKHLGIWVKAAVLAIAGSLIMDIWGAFGVSFLILLGLSLPFILIGGSFGYGSSRIFRIAEIISVASYGLWVYTYITTPNESMGDLALIAAYTVNVGFLAAFCMVLWLWYFVMRMVRSRRT